MHVYIHVCVCRCICMPSYVPVSLSGALCACVFDFGECKYCLHRHVQLCQLCFRNNSNNKNNKQTNSRTFAKILNFVFAQLNGEVLSQFDDVTVRKAKTKIQKKKNKKLKKEKQKTSCKNKRKDERNGCSQCGDLLKTGSSKRKKERKNQVEFAVAFMSFLVYFLIVLGTSAVQLARLRANGIHTTGF
ncbi:unnamed protein product [Ceratitis capitata]|uniref:(Mediterranean fruit fly) hypothetical protein n=1 Tax=Ceratitis capitata TaxID=7213 RepID=A0A811UZ41_CERCA|nr:unnamed protein product [Ceratitis capitata]